jgi:hypothetical protein
MPKKANSSSFDSVTLDDLFRGLPPAELSGIRRRRHVIRPVGGGEQPSRISKLREFDGLKPGRELDF